MRPMFDMLSAAANRASFHMPGHKGRMPFGPVDLYALDTTELATTDDLYAPERGIAQAQALYARAAGAASTLLLTNGSTTGNHVMLQLYAREGDTVLLPRNAHMSAVNGCIMGGLRVRWIPLTVTADGLCYIREESVLAAMEQYPEAKTVLLTRPDFYGGCLPLTRIAAEAHRRSMRLVVDEAHGAHLPWMETAASAGECGVDAWVQSVHKTLPGLTGAAALHLADERDHARALMLMRRGQSSSPNFVMLMSADDARAYMEDCGRERLRAVIAAADAVRAMLPGLGYRDAHALWRDTGLDFDSTRLVIDAPQGGAALAAALREKGIDAEMYDLRRVVFILSAMDDAADVLRIAEALGEIPPVQREIPKLPMLTDIPERAMEVRAAVMAACEPVPLAQCVGRVIAAAAGLYPPGIPLICPGERVTEAAAQKLLQAKNQERFGVEGDALLCVSV